MGRRDRGHAGVRICVFALVLGACLAATAASALADTINTPTVVGGTPQSGKPTQFSFTGSADASGTWLEVLVRPTGPIPCQSTYDNDQAAVPGSQVIYNRSYTVGPGQFTAPATYTPYTASSNPQSFVACVWLMQPNGTPPAGTTTAGPVSLTFTVNPPPPPPPPPPSSQQFAGSGILTRPAAGADTAGDKYIFWQGTDHRLWESYYVGSSQNVVKVAPAGKIYSAPAVAVHGSREQDVFWKGGDGRLWEAWWTGSWHGGIDLKTPKLTSDPAAGADAAGHEWVFWRGPDNRLYGIRYNGKAWGHAFRVRGTGTLTSGPGVAVNPDGSSVVVFYRGGDRGLWSETLTGNSWARSNLGNGPLGSAPTAGADRSGNLYVFWRGTHGGLWEATRQSGKWRAAGQLDFAGNLGTPPSAAVAANGSQHVFWGGADQNLWGIEYENGHW